jgi:N-dimethylarginine dimethylaminohydrolase
VVDPGVAIRALTRSVPPSIVNCELTHLEREPINFARAVEQHELYEKALVATGCTIQRLPSMPDLADSVFVEDTAVVLPERAILTRPGAESRRSQSVIYPIECNETRQRLEQKGINVIAIETDELHKAEGAVTCCSILIPTRYQP